MEKLYIDFKVNNIEKNTIEIETNGSLSVGSRLGGLSLGKRPPTHIVTRYPWELISDSYYKGLNLTINLNPDPNKIEEYNNKKYVNNILINYIENEKTITKAIGVYEWGKNGPKYGKLHYHIILKTQNRKGVEESLSELFNCRRNLKCRTISSKHLKDVKHREDYVNYMKKEQQNKNKTLFVKNI